VFVSAADHRLYLDLLARHAASCGARILGYCLMTDHVHLVAVPQREESLACMLGRVHSEYARAVNRPGARSGDLGRKRFFSCPLDGRHLIRALRYTDLNPVRAGLAAVAWQWPWSSARAHTRENPRDAALDRHWARYCGPWNYSGWKKILTAGTSGGESESVRLAPRKGAPPGAGEFAAGSEREEGGRLRVLPGGRAERTPAEIAWAIVEAALFDGGE
jgi:putative transposase